MVVADWRCDWIGLGMAELLAGRGHRVTLGVDGYMPGQRIQQYVRDAMTAAVARARRRRSSRSSGSSATTAPPSSSSTS